MPLLPNTTSTTPPRKEKSLDTAVTPRPCPTPTQIEVEDVKHTTIRPLELGHLLMEMKIETKRCQQITGNYCDSSSSSSISSLSVAASDRDGMLDVEDYLW